MESPWVFDAVTEPLNSPTLEVPYPSCYFEIISPIFLKSYFCYLQPKASSPTDLVEKEGNFLVLNKIL